MNLICLCLLLPIACVVALPTQYNTEGSQNDDLTNEFWSHHFGPDFKHAIHVQLEQTDTIDTGNAIEKHQSESKDGNKKRSAYIVHKANEQNNRNAANSMSVHLLQPHEIEALEKDMMSYAKGNKMIDSPIVVNLPASEGTMTKDNDHETPVVLNIPPVVYHGNANLVKQHPQFLENTKGLWSYNPKYSSYPNKPQYPFGKARTQYVKAHPSFEYKKNSFYDDNKQVDESQIASLNLPNETKSTSYEDQIHSNYNDKEQAQFEEGNEVKSEDKEKTE